MKRIRVSHRFARVSCAIAFYLKAIETHKKTIQSVNYFIISNNHWDTVCDDLTALLAGVGSTSIERWGTGVRVSLYWWFFSHSSYTSAQIPGNVRDTGVHGCGCKSFVRSRTTADAAKVCVLVPVLICWRKSIAPILYVTVWIGIFRIVFWKECQKLLTLKIDSDDRRVHTK